MNLTSTLQKAIDNLFTTAYKYFGIDKLSGARIILRKDLEEIGTEYGGWVIPISVLNADSICYCAGCGEDISFDIGLIDRFGCEIYAFDPTPRAVNHVKMVAGKNSKYHLYELGLWDKDEKLKFYTPRNPEHVSHSLLNLQKTDEFIEVKVDRLSGIMKKLGHNWIDLLKLDIEGAEYKVIKSLIQDGIDIKVICVEYDELFHQIDRNYKDRIRSSIRDLINSGYSIVCAQSNGNYTFLKDV